MRFSDQQTWITEEIFALSRQSMFEHFVDGKNNDDCIDTFNCLYFQEPSTSNIVKNDEIVKLLSVLKGKEKDLELTARIGVSLLEQNKELQERNEFLEESLSSSNDTVTQLRHQLEQRSTFFNTLAYFTEEEDEGEVERRSRTIKKSSSIQNLRERVKNLEEENKRLKFESVRLEESSNKIEEQEHKRVKEYLGQLERASLKISRLQDQISKKNKHCECQSAEIERLMREVLERREHEKELIVSNVDLNVQLSDAIQNHEHLCVDITKLQERYLEVMGMLQQTEDELRLNQKRIAVVYRTSSVDSLYDSLASELEASDSGCYNTPQFSARCDSQQSLAEREHKPMSVQLERLRQQTDCLPILESINCLSNAVSEADLEESNYSFHDGELVEFDALKSVVQREEPYDIPSKALVNAFKNCILEEEIKRPSRDRSALISASSSTSQSVHEFNFNEELNKQYKNYEDTGNECANLTSSKHIFPSLTSIINTDGIGKGYIDESKESTPVVETMTFSTISCKSFNSVAPAASTTSLNNGSNINLAFTSHRKIIGDINFERQIKNEKTLAERKASLSSMHSDGYYIINGKLSKNSSCSPVSFEHGILNVPFTDSTTTATSKHVINSTIAEKDLCANSKTFSGLNILSNVLWKPKAIFNFPALHTVNPGDSIINNKFSSDSETSINKLVRTSSSESISSINSNYDKPKLGEPGKPGTRDFDQSVRRLKLRKKIESDYAAFRKKRRLLPSKFGFEDFAVVKISCQSASKDCVKTFNHLIPQFVAKCQNSSGSNTNSNVEYNGLWKNFQLRIPHKIIEPSSCIFPCRLWNSKLKTINDISPAILGSSLPTAVFDNSVNDFTVARRTLPLNDNQIYKRRRSSSLPKSDDKKSANNGQCLLVRKHTQRSLRILSSSPNVAERLSIKQHSSKGLIANWLPWASKEATKILNESSLSNYSGGSAGINLLSCDNGGQLQQKQRLQMSSSSVFGIVRRGTSTNVKI